MTIRERYEAILQGKEPDRILWLPRMELWFRGHTARGTLPREFQGLSLREIEKKLGLGTPARQAKVASMSYRNVDLTRMQNGPHEITEFATPYGRIRQVFSRSSLTHELGFDRMWTEYPIKTIDDFSAVEHIISHMEFEPLYEKFHEYDEEVGQDGFPMAVHGHDPFHHFLLELAGYETGYTLLYTHRERVERLVDVIAEKFAERDAVLLDSPATLICIGQHFDTQMTPPPVFEQYMLPYYQNLSRKMHARGKKLACHADADCSRLLELMLDAGFDMAECFTCAPMVSCTLKDARTVWGEKLIIFGGVPSTILTASVGENEFRRYVDDMFRIIAPGKSIILGVGDNVMPEVIWDRFMYLTGEIERRGRYPIEG